MNKSPKSKKPKHWKSRKPDRPIIRSPFRDWIMEQGQLNVANQIGVSDRAVRSWLNGEFTPTIGFLEKIVKLSGGRITKKMILDHVNAAALLRQTSH